LRYELSVNNADLPFTPFPFRHHLLWVPDTQGFWNPGTGKTLKNMGLP
jgi:hypothetical protein